MSRQSERDDRRAYIRRRRRKCWGSECQFCGHGWHRAQSNYFIEKSGTCIFCMQALCKIFERGAAWAVQRRGRLWVWGARLDSVFAPKRVTKSTQKLDRKLRAIAGGVR